MLESNMKTAEELINIALKIFQSNKHPRAYKCLESLSALYLKKSMKSAHRQPIKDAQNFKTKAINALKQALKIVKTYFPIDSPHRTRIELKIKDLEQD